MEGKLKQSSLFWLSLFLTMPFLLFPIAPTLTLDVSKPIGQMMEENDVFIKFVSDFCVYQNSLFLVDRNNGQILVVDPNSGKLLKKISSLGQGPTELQDPLKIVVQEKKVYVIDTGYRGIKIFSIDGNFIDSIKIRMEYFTDFEGKSFDVYNNEIYLPEDNPGDQTLVSVYSPNGERVRGVIHGILGKKDAVEYVRQRTYHLRMDASGNIYLLFHLDRILKKYNPQGSLLWEKEINNHLLNEYPRDDGVRRNERGGINTRKKVFDLEIDKKDRIYVIHAGGGCIFDKNGTILHFLLDNPQNSSCMRCISLSNDYLISQTLFSSETLQLFHLEDELR